MAKIHGKTLNSIKKQMENGKQIPRILKEKELEEKYSPMDVRHALIEKYGQDEIKKIVLTKIMTSNKDVILRRLENVKIMIQGLEKSEDKIDIHKALLSIIDETKGW